MSYYKLDKRMVLFSDKFQIVLDVDLNTGIPKEVQDMYSYVLIDDNSKYEFTNVFADLYGLCKKLNIPQPYIFDFKNHEMNIGICSFKLDTTGNLIMVVGVKLDKKTLSDFIRIIKEDLGVDCLVNYKAKEFLDNNMEIPEPENNSDDILVSDVEDNSNTDLAEELVHQSEEN